MREWIQGKKECEKLWTDAFIEITNRKNDKNWCFVVCAPCRSAYMSGVCANVRARCEHWMSILRPLTSVLKWNYNQFIEGEWKMYTYNSIYTCSTNRNTHTHAKSVKYHRSMSRMLFQCASSWMMTAILNKKLRVRKTGERTQCDIFRGRETAKKKPAKITKKSYTKTLVLVHHIRFHL